MCDPVKLFADVLKEFDNHSKWSGAVLGKIKTISNTKVGSVGQVFVERLCGELSLPKMTAKTVRVRIAVAVCPNGEWLAHGMSGQDDDEVLLYVVGRAENEVLRWVEADIPLPEPQTIEGEVVS